MFHVMFFQPLIPPNTGNAIRMCAVTGATLHLIEPLGFDLSDAQLRRSGLDYHDLADVRIHPDFEAAMASLPGARVFAFRTQGATPFASVRYEADDVLLFGPEPTGLPPEIWRHPRTTDTLRIPMLPARRSLNLSNSAAIAVYEAWRQHGYAGDPLAGAGAAPGAEGGPAGGA